VSSRATFLSLCVLATAGGSAAGWLLRGTPAEPATQKPDTPPASAPATPPAAVVQAPAPAPKPASEPAPKKPMARFSNGVEVELLNGVKDPVALPWPAGRPWSPIQEKVHDDRGLDWYHHRDGSWSTTQMCTDEVSGKLVGVGNVFTDGGPPLPVRHQDAGTPPVK
jgi:hypothetical protein